MQPARPARADLLVVGGGINGTGVARDAAGRGLSVILVEKDDLGSATSSASSKLIHGGLRYLEHYEFRLVAEALAEREVLLRSAPHIVHPMKFVMPHVPALRPAWMIRAGLLLYDYLARRQTLSRSHAIDLRHSAYGAGLKPGLTRGFVYSDCRVDDARLVVLTARAAADLGATVSTRTACVDARREGNAWRARLRDASGTEWEVSCRAMVNAAGPWSKLFLQEVAHRPTPFELKLVKGSHILVPQLYQGDHAFILQNEDRRVVFVYGYEERYTLIGTTEVEVSTPLQPCAVSTAEIDYLLQAAGRYFERPISRADVAWSYCGVRPLYDDGAANPTAVSRDYVLHLDAPGGEAPVVSIFGGKITTYRRLAEEVLEKLAPWFGELRSPWTANAVLPGGAVAGLEAHSIALRQRYPRLPSEVLEGVGRRHGALASEVLRDAQDAADLGQHFGGGLYEREVDYFIAREWAVSAEDVLWRRTKLGLHLSASQQHALACYTGQRTGVRVR